ncbi:unnamed protein product [Lactuca virosa]|uniref:Terpene synthase N-terminal domain-containing protein n=1 Tax=Lactuca virosa TaxID=75947 RepID=A0AAU9PQM3_9ASTR|nr:unnamed protein product [Lactuca virosa]
MEPVRPLTDFPPSMWGDRFLLFSLDNSQLEALAKAMEEPKEQLRRLIIDQTIDSTKKLSLIYYVYRLVLSYHFMEDIDGQLDKLFKELNLQDYHEADLYTISIHFQVFRSHGYKLSSDVFKKFKDCSSGAFKEDMITDVRVMLSFYECTQLRIRGESILEEAFVFTEAQLKSVENTLEDECSTYDSLLNLAKVHFKYLQLLQKEELRIISQMIDITYRYDDGYTFPENTFKEYITLLFLD